MTVHALSCSVVSSSLGPCGLWPARLLCPWDSPGKNAGVVCHFLPQGYWNKFLRRIRQLYFLCFSCSAVSYCLWPLLEWLAISFSRGSSQSRDLTHVSCVFCIGRWILYHLSHQGSPGLLWGTIFFIGIKIYCDLIWKAYNTTAETIVFVEH